MSHSPSLGYRIFAPLKGFEPSPWQTANIIPSKIPTYTIPLGRFPTPIHEFSVPGLEDYDVWIKRDDLSSSDLTGNKVRKLEFLLADAKAESYDSVITIGGIQSNHARATAVAARQIGLEPHLILRSDKSPEDIDITGNLLWNRMIGSKINLVKPKTYYKQGSWNLVKQLEAQLIQQGKKPYPIPVGGSNTLGAFGYMETVKEIMNLEVKFDHIVFACGSGGTAAGLAIGARLAELPAKLHAVGVCDSPTYFYNHINEVARELGVDYSKFGGPEDWIKIYDGQGLGYAKSANDELEFLIKIASTSGIVLDPTYTGKALYQLVNKIVKESSSIKKGDKILFIHTGGSFGFFDKSDQLMPLFKKDQVVKMTVLGEE